MCSDSSELEMWVGSHHPVAHSHRHSPPPRVGNGDTLVLGGGFSAHREVSVDLMAGRNFFIMN